MASPVNDNWSPVSSKKEKQQAKKAQLQQEAARVSKGKGGRGAGKEKGKGKGKGNPSRGEGGAAANTAKGNPLSSVAQDSSSHQEDEKKEEVVQDQLLPVFSLEDVDQVICQRCLAFNVESTTPSAELRFITRGLVNNACACFRNSILQSLLCLWPFVNLLDELIQTCSYQIRSAFADSRCFVHWKEVLALYAEFTVDGNTGTGTSGYRKNAISGSNYGVDRRKLSLNAAEYMPITLAKFQRQADANRPPSRKAASASSTYGSGGCGNDGKVKGSQEDAMEFMTFLLDLLHEELVTAEKDVQDMEGGGVRTQEERSVTAAAASVISKSEMLKMREKIEEEEGKEQQGDKHVNATAATATSAAAAPAPAAAAAAAFDNLTDNASSSGESVEVVVVVESLAQRLAKLNVKSESTAVSTATLNSTTLSSVATISEKKKELQAENNCIFNSDSSKQVSLRDKKDQSRDRDKNQDEDGGGSGSGGWSTVSSSAQVKCVIDEPSRRAVITSHNASVINRMFHGSFRSEVLYKLKKTSSVTFQPFHSITLDMNPISNQVKQQFALLQQQQQQQLNGKKGNKGGKNHKKNGKNAAVGLGSSYNSGDSVENSLAAYFTSEEVVEGEISRQVRIHVLPEILTLHIGRFSFDYSKNAPVKVCSPISYPALLYIPSRYMSPDLEEQIVKNCIQKHVAAAADADAAQVVTVTSDDADSSRHLASVFSTTTTTTSTCSSARSCGGAGNGNGNENGNEEGDDGTPSRRRQEEVVCVYELVNVVLHHGVKASGGHYSSLCKDAAGQWRQLNDAKVSDIDEDIALSAVESVYILMYCKKQEILREIAEDEDKEWVR